MICVSIGDISYERCLEILDAVQMAEIRIDLSRLNKDQLARLFGSSTPVIATCRPGRLNDAERKEWLLLAIKSGASYVDLELEAPEEYRDAIVGEAGKKSCRVLISHHDHDETPDDERLDMLIDRCFACGADITKIACMAKRPSDCARLLSIYSRRAVEAHRIVAVSMGDAGRISRLAAPMLGAPFTFCAPDGGAFTAAGQLEYSRLTDFMELMSRG